MNAEILQLQEDATDKLNSEVKFQFIPAISYRRTVIAKEMQKLAVHTLAKNGKVGTGIVVGMPSVRGVDKGVSTAQGEAILPVDVIGQDELSMALSNGCRISAEEAAMMVWKCLHGFAVEGVGCLVSDNKAIEPLAGLEKDYKGCVGYRVSFELRLQIGSTPKCVCPAIDYTGGIVTLTNNTPGATIYYTEANPGEALSFPGPGNPNADIYGDPFGAEIGQVIRFAAYLAGYDGSNVGQATLLAD